MIRTRRTHGRAALIVLLAACALVVGGLTLPQFFEADEAQLMESQSAILEPESTVDVGDLASGSVNERSATGARSDAAGGERETLGSGLVDALAVADQFACFGMLLDLERNTPVAGAEVVLRLEGDLERSTTSDADGRFRLAWPVADEPRLSVRAQGYVELRRGAIALDTEHALHLAPAASIEVIGGGAIPAGKSGAEVFAVELRLGSNARRLPLRSEFDATGRARFVDLSPGEYFLWAQAPGAGVGMERVTLTQSEACVVRIDLPRAVAFEGRVLETDREAGIAGVELRVRPYMQGVWRDIEALAEQVVTTGDDGRFALESVHPGSILVDLRTPWGAQEQRRIELAGSTGRVTHDFRLDPPASLGGVVRDERGRPVARAIVTVSLEYPRGRPAEPVHYGNNPGDRARSVQTDERGDFRFENLPAGPDLHVTAAARADGTYRHGRFAESIAPPIKLELDAGEARDDLELLLEATGSLKGRVVDADGDPIDAAIVSGYRTGRKERWVEVRTSANGEFHVGGVIPGKYVFVAYHDDYELGDERMTWSAPDQLEHEFVLARHARIEVSVVDEFGNALPNALVTCRAIEQQEIERKRDIKRRTDDYGRATLTSIPPGEYAISANATDYEPTGDAQDVTVSTDADSAVEIVLRAKPRPERATVIGSATTPDGGVPRRLSFADRRGGVLSVLDGDFRLAGANPGRASLLLRAEDCVPHRTEALQLIPGSEYDLGVIEFQPASRVHLVVTTPDGTRRVGADAQLLPLPEAEGGAGGKRRLRAKDRGRGRLRFVDVPRRAWILRVSSEGFRTHRERITVAELDERLTIVLSPE